MISKEVWEDKLLEDKVKYYNRTRMSVELFCKRMNISELHFIKDFKNGGYKYSPETRAFTKVIKLTNKRPLQP